MFGPIPLGEFDLLRPLGEGATGKVWYGVHRPSGTPVAVKTLKPLLSNPEIPALFEREARAIASLAHPHIVALLDYGHVDPLSAERSRGDLTTGAPYLVMEHVSGGTLWERPVEDQAELCEFLAGTLSALGHAHSRGVLHRDVKPGNVLWPGPSDLREGIRLVDFGIAWFARSVADGPRSVGTPSYMAPEQLTGDLADLGPWTDLYALAALTWKLVCGQPPVTERNQIRMLSRKQDERFDQWNPLFDVPDGLEGCLRHALASDPTDRPAHAAEMAGGLGALAWPQWPTPVRRIPAPQLQGAGLAVLALRPPEPVGREEQALTLEAALSRVEEHGGIEVVTIDAPPGQDVLALVREFCDGSEEAGRAVAVRMDGRDEDLPTIVLRRLTGSAELDGDALANRLRRFLGARGEHSALAVEVLTDLLCRTGAPDLRRHQERERRVIAARVLALEAARQPVVVVVSGSVGFGRGIARQLVRIGRIEPLQVLLLVLDAEAAEDPRSVSPLLEHPRRTVVSLPPLDDEQLRDLAESLLPLRSSLRDRLIERAEGRPEALRDEILGLTAASALTPVGDRFRLAPGHELPPLRGVRLGALARLEAAGGTHARGVGELLAQLDGPCPDRLLEAAAAELDAKTDPALGRLARAGLIERTGARWRLCSAELAAALRGAPADRLAVLAAALLSATRSTREKIPAEWTVRLLEACGRTREALALRIRIASARDRRADHQRLALELTAALAQVEALDLGPVDPDRLALELLQVCVSSRTGAPGILAQAQELALRAEEGEAWSVAGEAWRQIAARWRRSGRPEDSLVPLEAAERAFRRADDAVGLARAWHSRGLALRELARFDEALEAMGRAADAAEPLDLLVACNALSDRSDLLQWVTRWDEAQADIDRCLALAATAPHAEHRRLGRTEQLQLWIYQGKLESARKLADTLIHDFRYLGAGTKLAGVLMLGGEVHRFLGDLDRAEDLYQQTQAIYEAIDSPMALIARANLAILEYLRGRIDDSFEDLDELYDEATSGQIRWLAEPMQLARAPAAAALGKWDLVDDVLDALEQQAADGGRMELDAVWVARELARLARGSGDPERRARVARLIGTVEARRAP